MSELFEPNPRWPGGPLVCLETNLPAFDDKKALESYITKYCPSAKVTRKGVCQTCQKWHFASE